METTVCPFFCVEMESKAGEHSFYPAPIEIFEIDARLVCIYLLYLFDASSL